MDRSTRATLSTYNTQIHVKSSAKDLSFPKLEIANFCTDPLTGSVQKSSAAGHQRPKVCGAIPEAKGNIA